MPVCVLIRARLVLRGIHARVGDELLGGLETVRIADFPGDGGRERVSDAGDGREPVTIRTVQQL